MQLDRSSALGPVFFAGRALRVTLFGLCLVLTPTSGTNVLALTADPTSTNVSTNRLEATPSPEKAKPVLQPGAVEPQHNLPSPSQQIAPLPSPSGSESGDQPNAKSTDRSQKTYSSSEGFEGSFKIVTVEPKVANSGDTVILYLSRPISRNLPSAVTFAGRGASIIDAKENELFVRVPDAIDSSDPIPIIVAVGSSTTPPYTDFLLKGAWWKQSVVVYFAVAGLGMIGGIALGAYVLRRRTFRVPETRSPVILSTVTSTPPEEIELPSLPEPDPPKELVEACGSECCVAYVGAGMSAQAGFPVWSEFVESLLEWALNEKLIDLPLGQSLRAAVKQGHEDSVADSIYFAARGHEDRLQQFMASTFLSKTPRLPEAHRHLRKIPFSAVLTTNFDNLLERTFEDLQPLVYTYQQGEALLGALARLQFFILKLFGSPEFPQTVLLAPAQFHQAVANSLLSQFMGGLFFSKTIFFVGASLDGIETYLNGITFSGDFANHQHFALVSVEGTAWQAKKDQLEKRFQIRVIPFSREAGFAQVPRFLEKLDTAVSSHRKSFVHTSSQQSCVKTISLENIGPFDSLTLELTPHWNILLGDNGVGKSNILRAIAIAICGSEAGPYADRIVGIRATADEKSLVNNIASITLTTDQDKRYLTKIQRGDVSTQVTSVPSRPLEAEGWLAIGFPALRTVTWNRKRNLTPEGLERLTASDLLFLIKAEPDPRLDNLKEWIVRLDYQIQKAADSTPYLEQRDELFRVISEVTPGLKISFAEVKDRTFEVMVRTDDGVVPLEAVSQGTSSLLGWVGVLLQRLYEVYGSKTIKDSEYGSTATMTIAPRMRYALVLIDEIDAHMHPKWQQLIVGKLREIFPNVQFIATTHSPLIVAGMEQNEVCLIRRESDGRVGLSRPPLDMRRWRADQVLTGPMFDLASTLPPHVYSALQRYSALAVREDLSAAETKELKDLEGQIDSPTLSSFEREEARDAFKVVEEALNEKIASMPSDKREQILKEARAQVIERTTKSRGLA